MLGWVFYMLLLGQSAWGGTPEIQHVVLVSVDGLRSDALTQLTKKRVPNFFRLMADAGTLDARCDSTLSLTLPNHTSMVTGRPVSGPHGHSWRTNSTPPPDATYHKHLGKYLPSIFDVAHDHGVATAILAGKDKFILMDRSWNGVHGAPDRVGENNGKDKVDLYMKDPDPNVLTNALIQRLQNERGQTLTLLHYRQPDGAGHGYGWDMTPGSPYLNSIENVDQHLGRIFAALDENTGLRSTTAILLTADHGGGVPFRSHIDPQAPEVYTIPFLAWVGGHGRGGDLYDWSGTARKRTSGNRPTSQSTSIRNGELGNAGLQLLGLPPVAGSVLNHRQDLKLVSPER